MIGDINPWIMCINKSIRDSTGYSYRSISTYTCDGQRLQGLLYINVVICTKHCVWK